MTRTDKFEILFMAVFAGFAITFATAWAAFGTHTLAAALTCAVDYLTAGGLLAVAYKRMSTPITPDGGESPYDTYEVGGAL